MNTNEAKQKRKAIYQHIENNELKSAFDAIKDLVGDQQNWLLTEKLNELETNYKYMIHYLIEGNKDPEQKKLHTQFIRNTYRLVDDALENLLLQSSSSLFFEKVRTANVRKHVSMSDYIDAISKQEDTLSFIDILPDGEEKQTRAKQNATEHQHTVQDMFYAVFTAPRANDDQISEYKSFLENSIISLNDKSMLISALTLNALQRFDVKKMELLLDVCKMEIPELAMRAITGIIPIFQKYEKRWKFFPEIIHRTNLLSDDPVFSRRLITAIIQYIQAHETERITKKLTEEIIPEMMKLSPMIGKKINLDEWMGESGIEDKNPEWQKIFDEAGLTDKLQEFSELQLGGADVFHSTFSNLKNYPFFNEMSNWFLPFDPGHPQIQQMFAEKSERDVLLSTLLNTQLMCNSDKYSMCFSMMMMPEEYRKMMISQLSAEGEEIRRMEEEELTLNPYGKEETTCKQYIQDLYRFFKLFPRKADFTDIFALPLNYHQIKLFEPIVSNPTHLKRIALYYFEKNNFAEALSAYKMLSRIIPDDSEIQQKIGYCHQMLGNTRNALHAYLKAELIDENNTWNLRRIAHCYRILKEPESALQYYRRLEQLKPDDMNIQLNIGHCYLELKEYEQALNYYFKVELSDSNNARAWRSIAWCAFLSRKFDVAQNYYRQILEKNPNVHDFLNAGHVEICLENPKEAVEFYKKSLEKTGSFDTFRAMLAEDEDELQEAGVDTDILPVILDKIRYDGES